MKIAVLGDIHGNVRALEAVLVEAEKADCERIFHTGDLVGHGPHSNETIDLIRARHIEGVRGELDVDAAETAGSLGFSERHFLKNLPFSLRPALGGSAVSLFHASPVDLYQPIEENTSEGRLEELADETGADVFLFGHGLRPFHRIVGGRHFICAGSVGRPQDGDPRACLAIVDVDRNVTVEFRRVPYAVKDMGR